MNQAHRFQTELLVAESREEELEFSIILVHAQDSLMNTILFNSVAGEFIKLYKEMKGDY